MTSLVSQSFLPSLVTSLPPSPQLSCCPVDNVMSPPMTRPVKDAHIIGSFDQALEYCNGDLVSDMNFELMNGKLVRMFLKSLTTRRPTTPPETFSDDGLYSAEFPCSTLIHSLLTCLTTFYLCASEALGDRRCLRILMLAMHDNGLPWPVICAAHEGQNVTCVSQPVRFATSMA